MFKTCDICDKPYKSMTYGVTPAENALIARIVYQSDATGVEYEFVVERDLHSPEGVFVATCTRPDGGLNTSARTIGGLVALIPDCVETWEEK